MGNIIKYGLKYISFLICLALTVAYISGCRTEAKISSEFMAVVAMPNDTLASLAEDYLDDPKKDWVIAEFNGINSIGSGQELIIPLKAFSRGGLTRTGYQTVPVLSYHNFSLTRSNRSTVTKSAFEKQMRLLKDRGYRVITMDQLFDFLEFKGQIPEKSVVITIDDGWRSVYDIAFPILKKYGYPATLFVYTDLIVGSRKALSWEHIREMAENGIDIQCHTKGHRNLTIINENESFREYFNAINNELILSAKIVKKKLNKECKYLSYPYSETNNLIVALLKKQGYRGAFTVKRGGNPFFIDNYRINRTMIYGNFSLKRFERNLEVSSDKALK